MIYTLSYTKEALKQLKKLEKTNQQRILSTLERIRIRPHHHVQRLVGSHYYKLRVGNYRLILDIADGKLIIHVIEIGHRKNIYK